MDKYAEITLFKGKIKYWIGSVNKNEYHGIDRDNLSSEGFVL